MIFSVNRQLDLTPRRLILCLAGLAIIVLTVLALAEYSGRPYVYLLFTAVSSVFLWYGFREKAIFFDTFISVFLWLGFWLKTTVRVAFADGRFSQATGAFDGTGEAFDDALIVSTVGMLGFIAASKIREKYLFVYPQNIESSYVVGLSTFYRNNRTLVLGGFVVFVLAIAITNAVLGIYQRGTIPSTILPFGTSGIFKWLLLFGLASISAVLIHLELLKNRKENYFVTLLGIFETFSSNVSLLSRGMVLNAGSILYGIYRSFSRYRIRLNWRYVIVVVCVFVILFTLSVFLVNTLRLKVYDELVSYDQIVKDALWPSASLIVDRWVGIEGVMAVTSSPDLGVSLWEEAWRERFSYNNPGFYDARFIESPYANADPSRGHFVSLPGIIAFFYYTGSLTALFGAIIVAGIFGALIEKLTYTWGGRNLILCSLIAQVVAYRFAHFGYVPRQSYLLFGSIILNLLLIYLLNLLLMRWYRRKGIAGFAEG